MKFDKRFVLGAALILGLGMNLSACGDDDNSGDGDKTCKVTKESCEEQNKDFDKDNCKCVDKGETKTCENGVTKESCEEKGQEFDAANCRCNTVKSDTCNDGNLDDNEICDNKDNNLLKKDEAFTCKAWFDANKAQMDENEKLVEDAEATPACGSGCTSLKQGTCKTTKDVLCGNGQIDEGEVCDVKDGNVIFADSVTDKSCKATYGNGAGEFVDDGIPGCNSKCDGWAKGTCDDKGTVKDVNGIVSCKASINVADKKASGEAEVVAAEGKTAKGTIVCALKSVKLDSIVKNIETYKDAAEGKVAGEFDASSISDAGEYGCFFFVAASGESNGVFCSADGAVKGLSDVETVADVALVDFKVESQVSADTLAKWTFADYNNTKDDPKNIATAIAAGIAPEEGSASALKLTWIPVGENGAKIAVKMTADNTEAHALTAIQITTSGATGLYGDSQKAAESSHLSISDVSSYTISSMKLTAKYEGGKLYITQVANEAESVVKELTLEKAYAESEITGFDASAKEINIYADNTSAKAISIDDITLVGAAK